MENFKNHVSPIRYLAVSAACRALAHTGGSSASRVSQLLFHSSTVPTLPDKTGRTFSAALDICPRVAVGIASLVAVSGPGPKIQSEFFLAATPPLQGGNISCV